MCVLPRPVYTTSLLCGLVRSCVVLGQSLGDLGSSWGCLGAVLWRSYGGLGRSWGGLGAVLGGLGRFWAVLCVHVRVNFCIVLVDVFALVWSWSRLAWS